MHLAMSSAMRGIDGGAERIGSGRTPRPQGAAHNVRAQQPSWAGGRARPPAFPACPQPTLGLPGWLGAGVGRSVGRYVYPGIGFRYCAVLLCFRLSCGIGFGICGFGFGPILMMHFPAVFTTLYCTLVSMICIYYLIITCIHYSHFLKYILLNLACLGWLCTVESL